MRIVVPVFFCLFLFIACKTHKTTQGGPGTIPPAQTLTISIFPSWGGSAEAILERKNGKDNLYSTYHEKISGRDTVLTQVTPLDTATADSVFTLAEKVHWNDDANRGTGDARTGLKFFMSWKKGRAEKSVSWENLKTIRELPPDILPVLIILNRVSPGELKLF